MATVKGNTNVTKKGTKQRSFNLDDATFAIVETEAERLHITNSAALSSILNDWQDEGPAERPTRAQEEAAVKHVQQHEVRDLSYLLPSETATNFEVNDPANDPTKHGAIGVKRTRSKLDNVLNDRTDVDTKKGKRRDADEDILGDR